MASRVYVLLDLEYEEIDHVAETLHGMPGIVSVDALEGPPDLAVIIEAPDREMAAKCLMAALDPIDGSMENLQVLPVCESREKVESRQERGAGRKGGHKVRKRRCNHDNGKVETLKDAGAMAAVQGT
jgi:hypothetical protein